MTLVAQSCETEPLHRDRLGRFSNLNKQGLSDESYSNRTVTKPEVGAASCQIKNDGLTERERLRLSASV